MAPTTDAQQRTRKIMKAAPNTGSLCFLQPGSPCGASVADLFWAWRPRGLPGAFPDLCRCVLAFLTIGLVRSSCGLRNRGAVSETTRKSCTLYLDVGSATTSPHSVPFLEMRPLTMGRIHSLRLRLHLPPPHRLHRHPLQPLPHHCAPPQHAHFSTILTACKAAYAPTDNAEAVLRRGRPDTDAAVNAEKSHGLWSNSLAYCSSPP